MVVSAMDPKLFINMLHVTLTGGPEKEKKKTPPIPVPELLLIDWLFNINHSGTIFADFVRNNATFTINLMHD